MASANPLRGFGQVFDQVADDYDAARPGYPPSLVAVAAERGGLAEGSRVLEVGCGTGKLTELLVARGWRVDAVDPGANMIAAARRRVGPTDAVAYHLGRFEEVDLPEGAFAAAFSATAFHWVDPSIGWAKVASLLEPGGLLALLTYIHLRDDESPEIERDLRAVVEKHAPHVTEQWREPRTLDELVAGVRARSRNVSAAWDWVMSDGMCSLTVEEAAGLFGDVDFSSEVKLQESTADEMIARIRTTSLYFRIDSARRAAFEDDSRRVVEQRGGIQRATVANVLLTARRR
jgi:SAM-dependent methyltransferase